MSALVHTGQGQTSECSVGVEIRTLGQFAITLIAPDGRREEMPGNALRHAKARKLLMLLLSRPNNMMTQDAAIEELWPKSAGRAGGQLLSNALWNIRHELRGSRGEGHDLLIAHREYIGLRLTEEWQQAFVGCWVDTRAFESQYGRVMRAISDEDGLEAAWEALALYRGDFLPGAVYDDWTTEMRERLREQWIQVGLAATQVLERRNEHERALALLTKLMGQASNHLDISRRTIALYMQLGRLDEAMRLYERISGQGKHRGQVSLQKMRDLAHEILALQSVRS